MIKKIVKTFLQIVAPKQYAQISSSRDNSHGQRVLQKHGVPVIAELFIKRYGPKVQAGPFADMVYLDQSIGSAFLPKLIGSYESELHFVIKKILAKQYDVVVDIGSAEGYYAVGFAMHLIGKPYVYAFDTDKAAQELCKELSIKNGVQNQVIVLGYCDTKQLETTLQGRSLVICDCEGYEIELLNPTKVPSLITSDLLVELHHNQHQAVTYTIMERFSVSHQIKLINTSPRNPAEYSTLHFLNPEQQEIALSEFRHGPQQWVYMSPKSTTN